jgi:predicted metalloprotease
VSNIGAISDFNVENLSRGYVNEHGSPKERTPETTTGFDGGKSNRCSSDVNLRAV